MHHSNVMSDKQRCGCAMHMPQHSNTHQHIITIGFAPVYSFRRMLHGCEAQGGDERGGGGLASHAHAQFKSGDEAHPRNTSTMQHTHAHALFRVLHTASTLQSYQHGFRCHTHVVWCGVPVLFACLTNACDCVAAQNHDIAAACV